VDDERRQDVKAPPDAESTGDFTSDSGLDALVGQLVRQYRIEEKLGAGGMGVVYLAHDTRLDRDVALKFLPRHVVADEAATERFVVEARAAAALDHPNVCTVHEIGRDEEDRPFIAMAYCEGETLKQRLERGAFPVDEASNIATQIVAGLNAAHAQGIVHRDVKPGNVIITPDGVAKILDFGLAKLADVSLTGTGITLGTAAYMSPEQTRGEELDARTDLWSLGVVFYEMLTGERPFKGDRQLAVIHAIRHEEPVAPRQLRPKVPPELEALVLGLLSKEPEDRTESARTLVGDLAPFATTQRPAPVNRRRMVRGVAGVIVLGAIGAGATAAVLAGLRSGADVPLDPDRVAVAVLVNQTGEPALDALGRQAAERITQAVHQREVADVVPTEVALEAAAARGRRQGMDAVAALARASGAGVVLHGAYYLLGDSLHFQIQITDVAEGEVMSALRPISVPRERTADALNLLQERTLGALAAALDFRDGELMWPTQPPSLEAYRLHRQGEDTWNRYEQEDALRYFERAWAMDSAWMTPFYWTTLTHGNLGRHAEIDSLLQVAAERTEHMSEVEYLLFRSLHIHYGDEDPTLKLRDARRLAELAPAGNRWAYFTAWQAYRPQEALDYLARVDTTGRTFGGFKEQEYRYMTALMHHMLGNHEAELEVAREWRRRFPGDVEAAGRRLNAHRHNLEALAAHGRLEEMDALLDTTLAQPHRERVGSDERLIPVRESIVIANVLRAHGRDEAARAVAQRGLDWVEKRPEDEVRAEPTGYRYQRAELLYALGRWTEARELFGQLVEQPGEDPVVAKLQSVLRWEALATTSRMAGTYRPGDAVVSRASATAQLGEVEQARTISAELGDWVDEVRRSGLDRDGAMTASLLLQRARIAAVLGEREQAVRFLEEGFRVTRHKGPFVYEARYAPDIHLLYDYPPFQKFVKPRG
jgi:tetratricopeptide (TPR) repeat protein